MKIDPIIKAALDETGLTPADPGFHAAARRCVVDLGIVRRRKVEVAADGQRAVAQVVLNRVRHPAFPATVCDVVYQGSV